MGRVKAWRSRQPMDMLYAQGLLNCVPESRANESPRMIRQLTQIIASRYGGRNIPVALVLPDGGRVALSERPEVDVYARTWRGLKALASPQLGALARAYVRNDLDFSGGAQRVLGIAEALVGGITHGREHIAARTRRSEEHTSELQSHVNLVCR